MPSPFPGMDPYLEAPDIWPDLHAALAVEISTELNHRLPRPYYARLWVRPELAIRARDEPPRHHSVGVHDASCGHALVTLIEIVSPTNKRFGPDRKAYEAKQQEILQSDTSLIELDLLRAGRPVIGGPVVSHTAFDLEPRPDYLVAVNRAWQRGPELEYELFPVRIEEPLPCIPVPLRENVPEVPLDLQYTFAQAYDGGPYARGAVDYGAPPDPPLDPDRADWLAGCLYRWRVM